MSEAPPYIHRPIPRRPFDLTPITPTEPDPISPITDDTDTGGGGGGGGAFKRTRSTVSLTTSTLFGIYGKNYDEGFLSRSNSFADFGAVLKPFTSLAAREETESRTHRPTSLSTHSSSSSSSSSPSSSSPKPTGILGLFVFGVVYGLIVTHLHERVPISNLKDVDRSTPGYLLFWGLAGVALGSVLPWIDGGRKKKGKEEEEEEGKWDWTPALRSLGVFAGIAYAIRRFSWQSTLQLSLTLALVNPILWFLVDRTRAGFWFATLVGIAGTAGLVNFSPNMIRTPPPITAISTNNENFALHAWIASVLFCSCVCFGNVGRKLVGEGA